jgi:glycosyltransferase involved in cell wall biosynthesis
MNDSRPGISVIIPSYNMGRFLSESVASVLDQHYERLEILIVDDGSTDDTPSRVERLPVPVRYIRQENRGPAAARNHGLDAARHELIAFLDADDLWPPGKLDDQLARLLEDPNRDFVIGHLRFFALRPGAAEDSHDYEFHPSQFIFLVGSGLYRRRVFEKIGRFDETMRYSEDTDWFFRCREGGVPYLLMPEVTVLYRRHPGSMTHGLDAVGKGYLGALKKSLDRRRAGAPRKPG